MFKLKTVIILLLVMQLQSAYVYFKYDAKGKAETQKVETTSNGETEEENISTSESKCLLVINDKIANESQVKPDNMFHNYESYLNKHMVPFGLINFNTMNMVYPFPDK